MEINAEKSKVMVNTCKSTYAEKYIYCSKLVEVVQFKYMGATLTKYGSSNQEIRIRLAQSTSAMVRLTVIWKHPHITFS